ncbi:MAG: ADP-ribosylglycohydrolase family protein, partial [Bacteroidales bacterium]|nr:ADP-ribosylglycohydrolase family protein [Bacteroidales bacterium]
MDFLHKIKSVLFGVAIGDALGVPVEFKSRQTISENPVTDMIGFGTYNLPSGTFSDDSSLTFCLAEALTLDFDIDVVAQNFVKWYQENFWTARGNVFDIGITTSIAIARLAQGVKPELAGNNDINSNGNGSLMRISPLMFYLLNKPVKERFEITRKVSSITHGHIQSVIACFYYLEFSRHLLSGENKFKIYKTLQKEIPEFLERNLIDRTETACFSRLLKGDIHALSEDEIQS